MINLFYKNLRYALCSFNIFKDYFDQTLFKTNNNSSVSGKFFLGVGGIGESLKYTVMAKEQDGFVVKELDPERTIVVEEENCDKPRYVERKTYEVKKKRDNLLSTILTDFVKEDTKTGFADYDYVLYIPKGSIKQGYEIDLE